MLIETMTFKAEADRYIFFSVSFWNQNQSQQFHLCHNLKISYFNYDLRFLKDSCAGCAKSTMKSVSNYCQE